MIFHIHFPLFSLMCKYMILRRPDAPRFFSAVRSSAVFFGDFRPDKVSAFRSGGHSIPLFCWEIPLCGLTPGHFADILLLKLEKTGDHT